MKKIFNLKKLALASAVGSLMVAGSAQAATVSYSMGDVYSGNKERIADNPVNDDTATQSSNPAHSNYVAPYSFLTASGSNVSPNYGWTQGGGLPAAWWAQIGGTDSASVNSADRIAARQQGGFIGGLGGDPADYASNEPTALSVGQGAYKDSATNWGHNADFGLITLTQAGDLTISVSGVTTASGDLIGSGTQGLRAGFSIWQGWDTAGGTRHTTWLPNGAPGFGAGGSGPFYNGTPAQSMSQVGDARGQDSLGTFLGTAYTLTNNGTATLSLTNLAAGNYYIAIGGYTNSLSAQGPIATGAGGATKQYVVSLSSTPAAVPVPAAAWLFGPALAGLGAIGRRKGKVA